MKLKSQSQESADLSLVYSQLNYATLVKFIDICFAENLIINRGLYKHFKDFFDNFKLKDFSSDIQREAAAYMVKFILKEKIERNLLTANDLIKTKLLSSGGRYSDVIQDIFKDLSPISDDEILAYSDYVSTQMKLIKVFSTIPKMQKMIFDIQNNDYMDVESMIRDQFEPLVDKLNYELKSIKNTQNTVYNDFDLRKESLQNIFTTTWRMRSTPGASIKTGIKELNNLLGGEGYESGRIYVHAAVAGKWKSGTLLNVALWARDYNQNIKCFDPTKKPCALYLSIENDNIETSERILSNRLKEEISSINDIRDFKTEKEVLDFVDNITDENTVDSMSLNGDKFNIFFKYRQYMSVDFNDIEVMIDEIESEGYECKLVIVDYLNRMRSITREIEEIQRLGSVVTQGSEFAKRRKLPVVTATQLTRGAMLKVEEAIRSGRKASGSDLGGADVGKCWAIYENCDVFLIGNPESVIDDRGNVKEYYMYKRSKLRGKKITGGRDMFYVPFIKGNGMALKEDYNTENNFALFSLGDSYEVNNAGKGKKLGNYLGRRNANREISDIPSKSNGEIVKENLSSNDNPFDEDLQI